MVYDFIDEAREQGRKEALQEVEKIIEEFCIKGEILWDIEDWNKLKQKLHSLFAIDVLDKI